MLARTANNLFWLARYVERAENTARILDAAARLSALPAGYGGTSNEWMSAVSATGGLSLYKELYDDESHRSVIDFLAFSPHNPSSIRSCIEAGRSNARAVRTAITAEMWDSINGAWLELKQFPAEGLTRPRLNELLSFVKESSLRFDGSAYRTMLRNDAYYFTRLGSYLERSDATARILDVKYHVLLPEGQPVGGSLDYFQWSSILRSVSALTAYNWVYRQNLRPWLVADLLILKREMPRSLASAYENLTRFLDEIARDYGRQGTSQRLARSTFARLQNSDIDSVFSEGLHEFLLSIIAENNRLGGAIAEQYLS
ncbi:alpha-E domain-containing protein [Amorphus orientalis]|uniref:alpha-E domain-containing protein n=1 Tax=Amorphus orientalis TaxID=649198 RepID=UPI0027D802C2|nr:alpha-E domain-containing protein [Amorphus orientalis]